MTLGEKIQQLRKASGISQEQLADQLNVSRQSVSKWELNDAIPEISKIVLLSDLFSISTDELLKDSHPQATEKKDANMHTSSLEQIVTLNAANQQIVIGSIMTVLGLIMLVLEFLFLPFFGTMQKAQVSGQGFYTEFIKYAGTQPMPIVFILTAIIIIVGIICFVKGYLKGYLNKKRNSSN